jgi:selenide,water dikinase
LARVPATPNENVLVGFETADDAGVYKLSPTQALVQTVDFFTPIVDDPYTFGGIAAANSLSDVYAMGGRPLTALSILAYPRDGDLDTLEQILRGGMDKMAEAGCTVIGGHSVADDEVKFGYAVTGLVHPDRIATNACARPGDVVLFSKSLGTGVIGTAVKRGIAVPEHVEAAVESMLKLNSGPAEMMALHNVHACTDVTGFGLIGHLREMALASYKTFEVDVDRVRFLPGALEYARQGAVPGGLKNNREFASCVVETRRELPEEVELLLYDPQTSGGLLMTMSEMDAAAIELNYDGFYRIGRVLEAQEHPIILV